jgi:myo-inositol-1(or 4)-monophosphatase
MSVDVDKLLLLAKQVAAVGATVHRQGFGRTLSPRTKSSELDLVSEIDLETERIMVAQILRERPEDSILSEEGTTSSGRSGVCWILDLLMARPTIFMAIQSSGLPSESRSTVAV